MLAEGFLQVLPYREEKRFASASRLDRSQINTHCADQCNHSISNSADVQTDLFEEGSNQDVLHSNQDTAGLLIPGCPPALTLDPGLSGCLDNCSLLEHYPDLQVADSGRITHNPLRPIITQDNSFSAQPLISDDFHHQDSTGQLQSPVPDQGYLVMGPSVNISLDLPGSGLEPMSNSVLNGMLEKQLEEVYLQHLTDNLARCNSHFGNSLLHGLVPPPKPSRQPQGPDSLEASLEEGPAKTISYLNTHSSARCSTHFSSPMLRISGTEDAQKQ
ncbi:uncharacterized protein LOC115426622 [Sphaeramia orbicularis]|uniref:uncharacterized protein LOC115426622 n=1 Tax=Sphaeramia orbicularis TaxID=375764 RepID=UPI00117FC14C|nr:uncharacterized protein LOC115426622 [Sphaeramia orbicularis]